MRSATRRNEMGRLSASLPYVQRMTSSQTNIGRPSKGTRTVLYARTSAAVAARVREEAAALGIPMSDLIAHILAEHFGLPMVAPNADPKFHQQELELKAS